ncbi:MAG: protoheme IX farnesyltransferase [Methanobacteriota archaeon]|uniref:Protoheme IX farnesyltransferase n=1 Tax=Marine Group III euryarchaeote TaxID=2173149 RepID=A0A7J4GQR6_9ARCH|nr:MAG: protoheme IX farnesyltransferase [Euryarchaeota archaeon]HIF36838.1 protoheme IX farnesyltransferase [Marine Group III euryarchaeote]
MKPRVVILLQATAICGVLVYDLREGYDNGRNTWDSLITSLIVLLGGSLASGGSMAINMWYERDIDPLMERTEKRPIPSGYISPNHALAFGILICASGIGLVSLLSNKEAGMITAFSAFFYIFIYTMFLKRRTPHNIVIGGLAGSTPPAIGWVAASGQIDSILPWLMVLTIFMWTPPHFWSLTLSKRKDYGEAGVPMLPVVKGEDVTRNHIAAYAISLILTTLLIVIYGNAGIIFLITGMLFSSYFAYCALSLRLTKSESDAWDLFKFSNIYLYSLFICLVIDSVYLVNL